MFKLSLVEPGMEPTIKNEASEKINFGRYYDLLSRYCFEYTEHTRQYDPAKERELDCVNHWLKDFNNNYIGISISKVKTYRFNAPTEIHECRILGTKDQWAEFERQFNLQFVGDNS